VDRGLEKIDRHLSELGVETIPHFAGAYIDATIYVTAKAEVKGQVRAEDSKDGKDSGVDQTSPTTSSPGSDGPLHRISRLKAANTPPVSVTPNDTLEKAVTLMRMHEFSQLPVMSGERDLKGLVSWKTIGVQLAESNACHEVRECMEQPREVRDTVSIFEVIREVSLHDCVLVRSADKRIIGIVTASDIVEQFQSLAEPFLVLGDIETRLRRLIERANFDSETLNGVCDPSDTDRTIENVGNLTFGEYKRLLEKDKNWSKLGLKLDRATFIKKLDKVRLIRNDIMHFDPDGISVDQLDTLRKFARFLDSLIHPRK